MEPTAVIGIWGGMALLISSITGPGLTTIPLLFQEAGWLTPTIFFLLFGGIAGAVSLYLVETMSTIHGNESFQARVEYSTVAHLYMGNKAHIIMQIFLYCALQSVNLSSIIISEQTFDSLLIRFFHKTCALSFTDGWICVSKINAAGSPFDSYILFSLGYIISAAMVLPLSMMSLVQNVKFQMVSVAVLFFVMISWVAIFTKNGLNREIPVVGSTQNSLVGFVLNNFAFITTVPSFVNELSPQVSIHRTIAYPIVAAVILYLIVGLMGAASFETAASSDILATLSASNQNKVLISMINILFPIAVLVTSVPVFAIVIRYNLVRGNFCSNKWAIVWSSLMPWLLIIPFQTKGWLILVMNWTALIFGSSTNFIIPLVLYISSKTYAASTVDTTGGDLFVLHREDSSASTRRQSIRVARRSFENPPVIITSAEDGDQRSSPNGLPALHLSTKRSSFNETSLVKIPDVNEAGEPSSSLDPNATPLRVIYSPSVSRSGSVGQVDRPAIILSHEDDSESGIQILSPSVDFPHAQLSRASSFAEGTGNLRSRNSSNAPNAEVRLSTSDAAAIASIVRRPSYSPTGRLESEESGRWEHPRPPLIFVAFRRTKWFRPMTAAKVILAFVCCAVLGNLIYTIVQTARGNG